MQTKWHFVALGIAALAFDYAIRIGRWRVLLCAGGANISVNACVAPFLGSIALNNLLPLRIGDFVRALVFPLSIGVRRISAAASLFLERLVDVLTLLFCVGIGLAANGRIGLPTWLESTAILLSILGAATLLLIYFFSGFVAAALLTVQEKTVLRSLPGVTSGARVLSDLLSQLNGMSRVRTLLTVLLLSIMIWLGEAGLFWALLQALDVRSTALDALAIMALATLSTLIPSSPGYIGPFHLMTFSAVTMLGAPPNTAASFALLSHLCLWMPTTLAGGIAISANPGLFRVMYSGKREIGP
jgi:uncharacterized protein (TIRG00374 family)